MKKTQRTLRVDSSTKAPVMQLAFELSLKKWKLVFSHNGRIRTLLAPGTYVRYNRRLKKPISFLSSADR